MAKVSVPLALDMTAFLTGVRSAGAALENSIGDKQLNKFNAGMTHSNVLISHFNKNVREISNAGKGFDLLGGSIGKIKGLLAGIGAGFGLNSIVNYLKESVLYADELEDRIATLKSAMIAGTDGNQKGLDVGRDMSDITGFADNLSKKLAIPQMNIVDALTKSLQAGIDPAKSKLITEFAANMSKQTRLPMEQAVEAMIMATQGKFKGIAQFGIFVDKSISDPVKQINDVFDKVKKMYGDTKFSESLVDPWDKLKIKHNEIKKGVGEIFMGGAQYLSKGVMAVVQGSEKIGEWIADGVKYPDRQKDKPLMIPQPMWNAIIEKSNKLSKNKDLNPNDVSSIENRKLIQSKIDAFGYKGSKGNYSNPFVFSGPEGLPSMASDEVLNTKREKDREEFVKMMERSEKEAKEKAEKEQRDRDEIDKIVSDYSSRNERSYFSERSKIAKLNQDVQVAPVSIVIQSKTPSAYKRSPMRRRGR